MRTQQRDFEIVVSYFKENIEWLKPYENHTTIYCKDPDNQSSEYIHLPNVGVESHTYLTHIVENYDDLAEMTLFTKADTTNVSIKNPLWFYGIPKRFYQNGLKTFQQRYKNTRASINWGKYTWGIYGFGMRSSSLTFGEWWDKYLEKPRPTTQNYYFEPGSIFSVHRDVIRSNPLSYYEKLLSCVNDHINPEENYYLTCSWFHVFITVPEIETYKVTASRSIVTKHLRGKASMKRYE